MLFRSASSRPRTSHSHYKARSLWHRKSEMADKTEATEVHPLVGLPDGFVDEAGEKIVYDYDDFGNFLGWHKEATE